MTSSINKLKDLKLFNHTIFFYVQNIVVPLIKVNILKLIRICLCLTTVILTLYFGFDQCTFKSVLFNSFNILSNSIRQPTFSKSPKDQLMSSSNEKHSSNKKVQIRHRSYTVPRIKRRKYSKNKKYVYKVF